jgi:hypothetical protein
MIIASETTEIERGPRTPSPKNFRAQLAQELDLRFDVECMTTEMD